MPGGHGIVTAYIGLGANVGDRMASIEAAVDLLGAWRPSAIANVSGAPSPGCASPTGARVIRVDAVSSVYETKPVGVVDQPDFLNAVVRVETALSARDLLFACLAIEASLGRVRNRRWGPRVIDMDVLLYGDEAVDEPGLVVPHPRLYQRAFALVPLAELAADLRPFGSAVSVRELAAMLPDRDDVRLVVQAPGFRVSNAPILA